MCAVNLKVTSKISWVFSNTTDEVIIFMYIYVFQGLTQRHYQWQVWRSIGLINLKLRLLQWKEMKHQTFQVFSEQNKHVSQFCYFFFKPVFIFLPWATSDMTIVTYVPYIWQVWFRITNIICFANIIHARTLNISHLYKAS